MTRACGRSKEILKLTSAGPVAGHRVERGPRIGLPRCPIRLNRPCLNDYAPPRRLRLSRVRSCEPTDRSGSRAGSVIRWRTRLATVDTVSREAEPRCRERAHEGPADLAVTPSARRAFPCTSVTAARPADQGGSAGAVDVGVDAVGVDAVGAGVVDAVDLPVGAGPFEGADGQPPATPVAVRLQPVVQPAFRAEVVRGGLARWPGVVERDHVVQVGGPGRPVAVGEDAVAVAQLDA